MKNLFILITIFIIGSVFYLATLKGIPGNLTPYQIKNVLDQATMPFELSPERGRYILTYSLAENKSFSLTNELGEAAAPDVGIHENKYYIQFGPGVSMLVLPMYILGKSYNLSQVFAFSTIALFAAFNLVFIYLIGRNIMRLPAGFSLFASIIFGFGSSSWSYAVSMYQHHITTFFILSTFYAVWKYSQKGRFAWINALYIWFIFGYSIFVDYPNVLLLSPVIFYFFLVSFSVKNSKDKLIINWRLSFLLSSVIFLSLLAIHGYYNYIHFGDWKRLSGELKGYKSIQREKELKASNQAEKITKEANNKSAVSFFSEEELPKSFTTLFFSIDRGLFLYAPIFALAFLGIVSLRKKIKPETGILLGVIAVNVFLYSSWGDPWGGWAFGPRYLIPSMAVLSIFVSVWMYYTKHKILGSLLAFFLFAYSSFVALMGVLTTNQVPPKSEADVLKMKYNFLLNWDYFMDGRSSSFIYNEYTAQYLSLTQYFLLVYYSLIFLVFIILFVLPIFRKSHDI